ncbi:iron-sulfur protein [Agromyces rhizosphaerae]|uniref:Cytochrome bc1 complex Rieske iron-sulfur subunit n=1 Tax=Agromyces rhizosphaerae TaxID=88374 RepID=A0A9W6D0S6_9MICO|nr:Rieske (2Fe-2S) protein [Agromyces rhizosphaerae]GLI28717.1 iron-sulfur protein [Agromyces rhizosphaerae]
MGDEARLTRRTALTLGAGGVASGAAMLAGCTPSDAGSGSDAADDTSSGGDTGAAAGTVIASLSDIPVGGTVSATIGSDPVLLSQPTAGEVVAFSAVCTHQQCVVAVEAAEIVCPCHGSRFDTATGDVLNGPALEPLPSVAVTVDGDDVVPG